MSRTVARERWLHQRLGYRGPEPPLQAAREGPDLDDDGRTGRNLSARTRSRGASQGVAQSNIRSWMFCDRTTSKINNYADRPTHCQLLRWCFLHRSGSNQYNRIAQAATTDAAANMVQIFSAFRNERIRAASARR